MINLRKEQIKRAIPLVRVGLEKYLWLQAELMKRNVAEDREYQKKFNGFYRVRRNSVWQKCFFELLETNKNKKPIFKDVLIALFEKTGNIEASFVSKLIATINPEMPIIDQLVFKNLGLKLPYTKAKNRELTIDKLYHNLIEEFIQFFATDEYKYLTDQFIKEYPNVRLTKVKMLDLVLWQVRD